jgi:hypothetical protein
LEKSQLKSKKDLVNNDNANQYSPNKKENRNTDRPLTSLRHVNSYNSLKYKHDKNITECTDNHSSSMKTRITRKLKITKN